MHGKYVRLLTAPSRVLFAETNVHAQTVMDASDQALSAVDRNALTKMLRQRLADPFAAQLINLRSPSAGVICGSFNIKNRFGGYIGFAPFVAKPAENSLIVIPPIIEANDRSSGQELQVALTRAKERLETTKQIVGICGEEK